jgi:hypothetical protein
MDRERLRILLIEDDEDDFFIVKTLYRKLVPHWVECHKRYVLEVPDGLAGEAAVILKETMIQGGRAYLSRVPVEVEVTIGETGQRTIQNESG